MIQSITNAILNTIFVSIPETLVWSIFVLVLIKEKNLLDIYFWKENLLKLLQIAIPISISINLMRYILHLNNLVNFIIIEIMMSVLMILLIKKNNFLNEKINYFKIVFYVILADLITIVTTEGICVLSITYLLHMTIDQINNNILLNILLSIIPRVFQILIISFSLYKQSVGEMVNCIELILKNKVLNISMTIFLFTVLTSNYYFQRIMNITQYLNKYILIVKVCLTILIALIPLVIIVSYIVSIFNLLLENNKLRREKENIYNNII